MSLSRRRPFDLDPDSTYREYRLAQPPKVVAKLLEQRFAREPQLDVSFRRLPMAERVERLAGPLRRGFAVRPRTALAHRVCRAHVRVSPLGAQTRLELEIDAQLDGRSVWLGGWLMLASLLTLLPFMEAGFDPSRLGALRVFLILSFLPGISAGSVMLTRGGRRWVERTRAAFEEQVHRVVKDVLQEAQALSAEPGQLSFAPDDGRGDLSVVSS